MHPLSDLKKWYPKLLKKITVRKIFVVRFKKKINHFIVYPTQYSKIVIEVIYCVCPTSELNGWVIFAGKKSNYELSLNCLRERQTLGMFFFSIFLLSLSCFLMSFFLFLLFLFPLLPPPFFAIFSQSPFCPFSPVLHSFMLSSGPL